MKKVGVALFGFGTVGSGTYNILISRKQQIAEEYGVDITVECVLEKYADRAIAKGCPSDIIVSDITEVLAMTQVDICVECIGGIEPAKSFLLAALAAGKSIVTANKELFAKNWCELEAVAKTTGSGLYYEATVGGGIPIIRTMTQGMQANNILEIKGIINGTTNYILSRMSNEGASYDDVLADAQALGYAEFNPTSDVEGYDSVNKLAILSCLAYNKYLPVDLIYREGITNIKKEDIAIGKSLGYTIKLLAIAKYHGKKIEARVHPVFISNSHPLASVNDSFNAIFIVGDNVGDIMLYGKGAGSLPTGSAVVSDIVFCARQLEHARYDEMNNRFTKADMIGDFESDYYLRLTVADRPGVLSKITSIFAKCDISIMSMRQDCGDGAVQCIFVTHKSSENNINKALVELNNITEVHRVESVIRVEN